jgi:hypothetical protein
MARKTMTIWGCVAFLLSGIVWYAAEKFKNPGSRGEWQAVNIGTTALTWDFYLEALYYSPRINAAVFIFGESSASFVKGEPTFGESAIFTEQNGRFAKYVSAKPNTLILMSSGKIVAELSLRKPISPKWRELISSELDFRNEVLAIAKDAAMADGKTIEQLEKIFAASPRKRYAFNNGAPGQRSTSRLIAALQ